MHHRHFHHAEHDRGGHRPPRPSRQAGPGGRHRARRGAVQASILTLLAERPMNGYELITELETRSEGRWRPSPGAIYPALSKMEERGAITSMMSTADEAGGKLQFQLTERGRTMLAYYIEEQGEGAAPRGVHRPARVAAISVANSSSWSARPGGCAGSARRPGPPSQRDHRRGDGQADRRCQRGTGRSGRRAGRPIRQLTTGRAPAPGGGVGTLTGEVGEVVRRCLAPMHDLAVSVPWGAAVEEVDRPFDRGGHEALELRRGHEPGRGIERATRTHPPASTDGRPARLDRVGVDDEGRWFRRAARCVATLRRTSRGRARAARPRVRRPRRCAIRGGRSTGRGTRCTSRAAPCRPTRDPPRPRFDRGASGSPRRTSSRG